MIAMMLDCRSTLNCDNGSPHASPYFPHSRIFHVRPHIEYWIGKQILQWYLRVMTVMMMREKSLVKTMHDVYFTCTVKYTKRCATYIFGNIQDGTTGWLAGSPQLGIRFPFFGWFTRKPVNCSCCTTILRPSTYLDSIEFDVLRVFETSVLESSIHAIHLFPFVHRASWFRVQQTLHNLLHHHPISPSMHDTDA